MPEFHLITEKHSKNTRLKILSKNTATYRKVQEKIAWKDARTVDFSRFLLMLQYFFYIFLDINGFLGMPV